MFIILSFTEAAYGFDDKTKSFEGRLSDKSICMISRQGKDGEYRHYDVHSLYGWSEAPPTLRLLIYQYIQTWIIV